VKKKIMIVLALCTVLAITGVLASSGGIVAQTDRIWTCLNPTNVPGAERIFFTGTLDDAQTFYQQTTTPESLKGATICQWTDGLTITIPTEEAVTEILTGTSHSRSEVMSLYTKSGDQWVAGTTPSAFQPSGNTATVEQVAINAVMAGCKPEYLPGVLGMMSGGPNFSAEAGPTGYYQVLSGPYAKEIGMNAGQGAMNPGNPPSMTIGRAFTLCLINLGGAVAGTTNPSIGNVLSHAELCYAEDNEALPTGWVGMNEDFGFAADESVIMLGLAKTHMYSNNAPSSFRGLNAGSGGVARKLGVEGVPGYYNYLEYIMELMLIPDRTDYDVHGSFPGDVITGPICFTMCPDCAKSLYNFGFKTKAEFYTWIYNRASVPMSAFKKYGMYDVITDTGAAIEPTSGKAYNTLADDYMIHIFGTADQQLAVISIYPGDEFLIMNSGGRGIGRCIDPWR